MKTAFLVDLDNCISDDQWRLPKIQYHHPMPNDRYRDYHLACHADLPGHSNLARVREIARNHRIVIATSRPEIVRCITRRWFGKWGVPHADILMRANDDHRDPLILKAEMLAIAREKYNVEGAVDDRLDILDMYRSHGVTHIEHLFIYDQKGKHP